MWLGAMDGGSEPDTRIDLGGLFAGGGGSGIQFLRAIDVGRSELIFEDQRSGVLTHVSDFDAVFIRHGYVVNARLGADVSVTASKSAAFHSGNAKVAVSGQLSYPEGGTTPVVSATIRASEGKVLPGGDTGPPLPLRSLGADVNLDWSSGRIQLTTAHAEVGTAVIEGAAVATPTDAGWELTADSTIRKFAVAELRRFWPANAGVAVRHWIIENIPEGAVSDGRCAIRMRPASAAVPKEEPVDLRFRYQGLVVRYFGELDPARALEGTAHLTSHGFETRVSSGNVGDLKITSGNVAIKFGSTPAKLTTSVDVAGSASAILAELAHRPLEIPAKVGIEPSAVGGVATAHIDVDVPLQGGSSQEVRWAGHADVVDASARNLVGGVGIDDGKLSVRVDGPRLEIEGDIVPVGVPGLSSRSRMTLRYDPADEAGQLKLRIDGADVNGEGTATFGSSGLREVSVAVLRFGATNLAGKVTLRPDEGYQVAIDGESIDLEPLFRGDGSVSDAAKALSRAYDAEFHVKKVLLGSGREIHDLVGTGAGTGSRIDHFTAKATVGNGTPLDIDFRPVHGLRRLRVRSPDAGEVLRAAGAPTEIQGGRLTFIARLPNAPDGDPSGILLIDDFRVVRARLLARILAAGSLTGIEDLLHGGGLAFTRARVPFRWKPGRIEIVEARAVGSIGITADGAFDRSAGKIELRGHVIPAYTLNAALGRIPFIGKFLVGGKGEGVFGIEYRVSGPMDQPNVDVNALSALAPGVLRKLFVDPFTQPDEDAQAGAQ
jgi:hypothetical protein